MIAHRRIWFYRIPGQTFAQKIAFPNPVTAVQVREFLRRTLGARGVEIWSH